MEKLDQANEVNAIIEKGSVPPLKRYDAVLFTKPDKPTRQTSDNDRSEITSHAQVVFKPREAEVTCTCNFNLFRWRHNRGAQS